MRPQSSLTSQLLTKLLLPPLLISRGGDFWSGPGLNTTVYADYVKSSQFEDLTAIMKTWLSALCG